ncbi:unnamed protein product, partial [Urochloa humidicola]
MSKDQSFILDFRTPKPAVLCSSREKLWNTEVHKIAHSLGDNDNLSGAGPISDGFKSQLVAPNSSYKPQVTLLKPSFRRSKPEEKSKLRYSSVEHPDADNSNKSSQPDPTGSSSAILHMPVIQVSENLGRNHAELLNKTSQGGGITKAQQVSLGIKNLDTRRK